LSGELKNFQSIVNEFDDIDLAGMKSATDLLASRVAALERASFSDGALSPEVEAKLNSKIASFVESLSHVSSRNLFCSLT
jgi:hypothetical protein